MRLAQVKALILGFLLAFTMPALAQEDIPALDADQIAALESAESVDAAVAALIEAGADPAVVALALSERGATPAQVVAALVRANVPAAAATTAVRTAVPSASAAQLTQGLAAAGVTGDAASAAVAAAPAPTAPPAPPAAPPAVASVTSAGLLVGADGKAVFVATEADQLRMATAFLEQTLKNDPQALSNPQLINNISQVMGSAISSASGGSVSPAQIAAALQTQLQELASGGGEVSIGDLAGAVNEAVQDIKDSNPDIVIVVPPVSATV